MYVYIYIHIYILYYAPGTLGGTKGVPRTGGRAAMSKTDISRTKVPRVGLPLGDWPVCREISPHGDKILIESNPYACRFLAQANNSMLCDEG